MPGSHDTARRRLFSGDAPVTSALLNFRQRSLLRANLLVLGSAIAAIPLSHFPRLQPSPLLILPALIALIGTADTIRCIQPRW